MSPGGRHQDWARASTDRVYGMSKYIIDDGKCVNEYNINIDMEMNIIWNGYWVMYDLDCATSVEADDALGDQSFDIIG